ncbi:MAG: hypothetical protein CME06_15635 [Gemmatimonadetes bacterium]|nr:hypothetical protein [Gemmatimonadota bacterium]
MNAPIAPFLRAEEIDHLVHLAFQVQPMRNETTMERSNVEGTRHVLEEALSAGVDHITVLSSATAYGAYPDNPLRLTEKAPLRAFCSFSHPRHKALVESRIAHLRVRARITCHLGAQMWCRWDTK